MPVQAGLNLTLSETLKQFSRDEAQILSFSPIERIAKILTKLLG